MSTTSKRRFRISPALVVSVIAMFAALSGAAMALPGQNTVNSGDVIDNTLKARDIKNGGVKHPDLADNSVKGSNIGDAIHAHANSTTVSGGVNQNGAYSVESVTASCSPGEELISGSGHWGNAANEELFLQEVVLNHNNETVTVAGGNDTNSNRTLFAVAHCMSA